MTVVVLQPGYLPWLGFFDQMRRADVFVYYDDVQYDTHGWRNRNRIKTQHGPLWLTVPVRHSGLSKPRILDVAIDARTSWAKKHVASIRQAYAAAPFVTHYVPALEELLMRSWERLVDLDLAVAGLMTAWLGMRARIERASALGIDGGQTERLVHICRHFGATNYFSGSAARDYLDVALFERHGIAVQWQDFTHPVYPQLHGEFVPYMSALDLILNCGEESRVVLEAASRVE
jgi:WbqC-like protein